MTWGRGVEQKMTKVWLGGPVKKYHFASDVPFEWPLTKTTFTKVYVFAR